MTLAAPVHAFPSRTLSIAERVDAADWPEVEIQLDAGGCALIPRLVSSEETQRIVALYEDDRGFRRRVAMARHGFGRGEYKYFAYPLPDLVTELREAFYPHLRATANRWNEWMGLDPRFPEDHSEFLERCHAAGQSRPTPLLLQYGEGDYNCLHQDLYGEHVFPLQVAVLLSEPG